tara:strand:+ start:4874 stop:5329 length:456 start_codon:yes stop_codon:yes gene_type:complete
MTDIAFYHLQKTNLEDALPKLLERTLAAGKRALVRSGSSERVEALNAILWTHGKDSWLPHGSVKDGHAEDQPIWLTTDNDNPNGASFVFLTDNIEATDLDQFERCFDLFDGNDEASVTAARTRWKELSDAGHELHYWQQNEQGKWVEKAST